MSIEDVFSLTESMRMAIVKVRVNVRRRIIMKTINITNARKELYKLVQRVIDSHEPVHITGKKGSAVMISEEDWGNIEETLYLSSLPGMKESIQEGMKTEIDECSEELEW